MRGLIDSRDRAAAAIAIQLAPSLTDAFVLTHSASATVREAVLHTPPERVFCTVSAPFEEGRAFAEDLRAAGLDVELVDDADAEQALAARVALPDRRRHGLPRRRRLQQGRHAAARRGGDAAAAFEPSSRAR